MLTSMSLQRLKHVAFLTGCPSVSTKKEMQSNLAAYLQQPLVPPDQAKILSLDMGIRNLAFCVLDASALSRPHARPETLSNDNGRTTHKTTDLRICAWEKYDLLDSLTDNHSRIDHARSKESSSMSMDSLPTDNKDTKLATNLFSPSSLSRVAYRLVQHLLKYDPAVVLIERQRFRSGGGSAIQEWTVRVNMLESMLWACFETLKNVGSPAQLQSPTIYATNPARIAKFWTAGHGIALQADHLVSSSTSDAKTLFEPTGRRKVTKAERIGVVRDWLGNEGKADVTLRFEGGARQAADAFSKPPGSSKRRRSASTIGPTKKLDDLTDCLLQGAAWVRWEENRRRLSSLLQQT